MPLYEYECTVCHKHTEKIQKFSDKEITDCPFCGGKLQRVLSAPAIAFKGGGWFKDGYGNAKPAASGGSEGASSDTASSAKDAPASKSDAAPSGTPAPSSTPAPAAPSTPAPSSEKK